MEHALARHALARHAVPLLLAFALAIAAGSAFAQQDPATPDETGLGPLDSGTVVTRPLDTADVLTHLGLLGWGFEYSAEEPFTSVSVALVAMSRTHLEDAFTRTPIGGAFTSVRPEPSQIAQLAVVLDARAAAPVLTLRVDTDTSRGEVEIPPELGASAATVRRPYGTGLVVPTDPDGRFLLVEAYRETAEGISSTGDVADMLAYLALEVRVE